MLDKGKKTFRTKVAHETHVFFLYTLFLWFLFAIFNIYQRLLTNDFTSHKIYYGYALVEALILAKVIIIGKELKIGRRFTRMPLAYIVLYKTVLFSLAVFILTIIEHFISGHINGHTISQTYHAIILEHINIILARLFIMFIIFILFFSFTEVGEIMGEGKLIKLFFSRRD